MAAHERLGRAVALDGAADCGTHGLLEPVADPRGDRSGGLLAGRLLEIPVRIPETDNRASAEQRSACSLLVAETSAKTLGKTVHRQMVRVYEIRVGTGNRLRAIVVKAVVRRNAIESALHDTVPRFFSLSE